jgi:hypothetical protein
MENELPHPSPAPAAQSAIASLTLYRTNVALPDSMACQPLQERFVFFEATEGRQLATLVNFLTWAWHSPAEEWLRDGLIYNTWSEKDLYYGSVSQGDARLFEIAWHWDCTSNARDARNVVFANAVDVDLFVSPRTRARLDKAMQAIATKPAAPPQSTCCAGCSRMADWLT